MAPPASAVASDVQSLARPADRWRKRLFVADAHNGCPLDFRLPHERTIAMGWQVRL